MNDQISAIILSGGQGQRFNGKDKGLVLWHGKPLIQHVIDRLEKQVGSLFISCHRNPEKYKALGYKTRTDLSEAFLGPLAGIQATCELITTHWCVLCPNDIPCLPDDLVARLYSAAKQNGCQITYPICGDRHHYLPALVNAEVLHSCHRYIQEGGRSLKNWYSNYQTCCVNFDDASLQLTNVNTATTLSQLSFPG